MTLLAARMLISLYNRTHCVTINKFATRTIIKLIMPLISRKYGNTPTGRSNKE